MAGRINAQINGNVVKSKKKGKALTNAIASSFSPESIAKAKPEKQSIKK
jgi:hypothetical protein